MTLQIFFHAIIIHNVAMADVLNQFTCILKTSLFIGLDRIKIISIHRKADFFTLNFFCLSFYELKGPLTYSMSSQLL